MTFLWILFLVFVALTIINIARYIATRFAHRSTRLMRIYSGYSVLGLVIVCLIIAALH